jgi:hypothetical protein
MPAVQDMKRPPQRPAGTKIRRLHQPSRAWKNRHGDPQARRSDGCAGRFGHKKTAAQPQAGRIESRQSGAIRHMPDASQNLPLTFRYSGQITPVMHLNPRMKR